MIIVYQSKMFRLTKKSLLNVFFFVTLCSILFLLSTVTHTRKAVHDDGADDRILESVAATNSSLTMNTSHVRPHKKSILIYSTLFGMQYWPTLSLNEIQTFMDRCVIKDCTITYNKQAISSADAVLFHGVDVQNEPAYTSDNLRNVWKQRRSDQKWVFFIQESPDNYNGFDSYSGLFDWLMSYKYTSDILIPYGHFAPLDKWDAVPSRSMDYAEGKDKLLIWFVSNCGHTRDEYIKELKKYVPISVGGKCAMNIFNQSTKCDHGSAECEKFMKRHKFFIAFENSFCDYYVTEKYWHHGIERGLVPVVMGARYDNSNVIPNSYIDASKFTSIKELALHLIYLDEHDEEYNKYFEWKQKYKRVSYEKMCELCRALHERRYSKPYTRIWSAELDCKPFQWKIEQMKQLVKLANENSEK